MPKGNPHPVTRGRTDHMPDERKINRIITLRKMGHGYTAIARMTGVSDKTARKYCEARL